jgi:hypothetical protein
MPFGSLHDFFEKSCPDGAGFALARDLVETIVAGSIAQLQANPKLRTDLPLFGANSVHFTFAPDAATLKISASWELSLDLTVTLHEPGNPASKIVDVLYRLPTVKFDAAYDAGSGSCFWRAAPGQTLQKVSETWEPSGQALINCGYADGSGQPDKQRFLDEVYYGFVWVNAARLMDTVFGAIPFPQLQIYLGPIRLKAPIQFQQTAEYFAAWSNEVELVNLMCGESQAPPTPSATSVQVTTTSAIKSPIDTKSPPAAVYLAAKNLVNWYAGVLAPALMISSGGGGFVKWSVDAAVSLRSLRLDLVQSQYGGGLLLEAKLRLAGVADSWIDGPCGSKLSLASAGITADAGARASANVTYDPNKRVLRLACQVSADVDKNSVNITTGGLLGGVFGEVVEILYKSGALKIDTSFTRRMECDLLDLAELDVRGNQAQQRIGDKSALFAFDLGPNPNPSNQGRQLQDGTKE